MTRYFKPPQTFAESQRALALWLAAAAGVFLGVGTAGIVLIIWLGGWAAATEVQRIGVISIVAIGSLAGMISVIVGLLLGGPVGRFKAEVNRDGAIFEAEDGDRQ